MKTLKPLLIGRPFIYKMIDFNLLKANNIEPILIYTNNELTLNQGNSIFCDKICFTEIEGIVLKNKIDAIICYNDNSLVDVAKIRTKYNIPGIQFPEIKKFKIKSEMYENVKSYLNTPKTICFKKNLKHENLIKILNTEQFFIKPQNLAGSEASRHIKNKKDYTDWIKYKYNPNIRYIIQDFYSDPIYHCELIVQNNNIKYLHARKYSYHNHLFLQNKIIASFPILDINLQNKIEETASKIQKILHFNNGVMHTEFFVDKNYNLTFLETNIRQPGASVNILHKKRAGISFETCMILLELHHPINISTKIFDNLYDSAGYIPRKKGIVKKIELPKLKGRYEFDIRVKTNQFYESPKSCSDVGISYTGTNNTYLELEEDFYYLENNDIIINS